MITSIDQLAKLIGNAAKSSLKSLINQDYLHIHRCHHPNSPSLTLTTIIKSTAIITATTTTTTIIIITIIIVVVVVIIIIIVIIFVVLIVIILILVFFFMCNTYLLPRL